ncbi:SGNH hydrolase [Microthyrium microscopicum]|uniref:SGNH hydrolase n=1 Tax=Microthyrium microscopicum TaxID=703497 RepID=A0A6A6US76_9PEZI|nr:SGNH hydrolase [Microthyrium microscopicum]
MFTNALLAVLTISPVLALPSNAPVSAAHVRSTLDLPKGIKLRINTLGDSITYGVTGSPVGNSYRPELLKLLTAAGATVEYVGNAKSGSPPQAHDGYPGATIAEIGQYGLKAMALKPNVITLMAGTNDTPKGYSFPGDGFHGPEGAIDRMGKAIDALTARSPETVVLVATLTPMFFEANLKDKDNQPKKRSTEIFNEALPAMIKTRVDGGKKVHLVTLPKMDFAKGGKDTQEGIHPSNAGYKKMAAAFFTGIEEAAAKNWIKDPA